MASIWKTNKVHKKDVTSWWQEEIYSEQAMKFIQELCKKTKRYPKIRAVASFQNNRFAYEEIKSDLFDAVEVLHT